ncbi:MAG TPA: hypothetical protein VE420_11015 [Gemmatimonadales bacterium]|nr:hypothetical protein [Gemmatimonadales bacterium]
MGFTARILLVLMLGAAPLAAQVSAPASARALWDLYVELGTGFDPALADLYADNAIIRNTRRYPDGGTRKLEMTAEEYKALIRQAMPLARSRGDVDVYSNVRFEDLGDRTRITASRYSTLKKYRAPHQLIVGNPDSAGWKILEEIGESRP